MRLRILYNAPSPHLSSRRLSENDLATRQHPIPSKEEDQKFGIIEVVRLISARKVSYIRGLFCSKFTNGSYFANSNFLL